MRDHILLKIPWNEYLYKYIDYPTGVIFFIPRGFAPWDEKMTPLGLAISMHPSK